jgi:hypothetical protein
MFGLRLPRADELIDITLAGANGSQVGDLSTMIWRHIGNCDGLFVDIHANEECARLGHG